MPDQPHSTSTAGALGGRYRLRAVIARGGMATVHRATDELLQRDVAVKVLHDHLADDATFLDRFRREARAAAALSHPNVVAIFDCDESDAGAYLVMELVEGMSLREVLRVRGSLSPGEALALLAPAAAGLAAAHDAGLVHRDVKPENVLLSREGVVKVTDFGLARAAAATTHTFGPGMMAGSPHYLAPEAVESGTVDARADVYSLGILLYECLVGRPPYEGDSPVATALQHTTRSVPPPSDSVGDVGGLDEVVRRATAADPDERYADGAEFAAALREAVPEGPSRVDLRDGSTDTVLIPLDGAETMIRSPGKPAGRRTWRRRGRRLLQALLVLALLGGAAWGVWATVIAPVQSLPDVRDMTQAAATSTLQQAGFEVAAAEERPFDIDVAEGRVLRTQPEASARQGSTVRLVISAGPRQLEVPEVAGQDEAAAQRLLTEAGLIPEVQRVFHDQVEAGLAAGTDPPVGSTVSEGSTVALLVSKGPEPIAVPSVVGLTEAEAVAALHESGLTGTVAESRNDPDVAAGRVLAQDPAPSEILQRGDTVTLVLSDGPEPFPMPDVVGEPEEPVIKALERAGLQVSVLYRETIFGRAGRVASQDPPAGRDVAPGDEVTIWVWE